MFFEILIPLAVLIIVLIIKKPDDIALRKMLIFYAVFVAGAFVALVLASFLEGFAFNKLKGFLWARNLHFVNFFKAIIVAIFEEITKFAVFAGLCLVFFKNLIQNETTQKAKIVFTKLFLQKTNFQNEEISVASNDFTISLLNNLAFVFAFFFASFENLAYAMYFSSTLFFRLFTATLLHVGLALFYTQMILENKKNLAFLILLHAIYNFSTNYKLLFGTVGIAVLLYCSKKLVYFLKKTS